MANELNALDTDSLFSQIQGRARGRRRRGGAPEAASGDGNVTGRGPRNYVELALHTLLCGIEEERGIYLWLENLLCPRTNSGQSMGLYSVCSFAYCPNDLLLIHGTRCNLVQGRRRIYMAFSENGVLGF